VLPPRWGDGLSLVCALSCYSRNSGTMQALLRTSLLGVASFCFAADNAAVSGKAIFKGAKPALRPLTMDATPACAKQHAKPVLAEEVVAAADGSLAYVPATSGRTRVVSVSRTGAATDLELPPGVYAYPRVTADQRRLLIAESTAEMLVMDLERRTTTRIGPLAHGVSWGVWVAGDQRVAMRLFSVPNVSSPDGGSALSPVPGAVVNDYPSDAGPDADSLLVTRVTPKQSGDVYLFSLSGAYAPKPLVATPGYDGGASLSADRRWMTFYSSSSGQGEAYVTRFPDADGLYIGGGAWLSEPVCQALEREFGKPAISNQSCLIWDNLTRLNHWRPLPGQGMLLSSP